jgi:flagellar motor switch protein FliN/FliY
VASIGKEWNPMADEAEPIGQDEIEQLLKQAEDAAQQAASPTEPSSAQEASAAAGQPLTAGAATTAGVKNTPPLHGSPAAHPAGEAKAGDDIQYLLDQAEEAIASVDDPVTAPNDTRPYRLADFSGSPASEEQATLDLLNDVELDVKIELGRTLMHLEDVLKLRSGSVVALDKLAGDPVDVYVNGRLIARGEVLVLNDNFCVRVAELISGDHGD